MIEVKIYRDGVEIGNMVMEGLGEEETEFRDYRIKSWIERGNARSLHNRVIYGYPRKYYNAFGMILQALNALNEKDLKLERDFDPDQEEATVSSDLARRLDPVVREIQSRFSRLHRD